MVAGFYIDKEGLDDAHGTNYTARVLVVTGALNEPGARDGVDLSERRRQPAAHCPLR
jgi:hypothetical protein